MWSLQQCYPPHTDPLQKIRAKPRAPKKTHSFSGHLQQGVWRLGCISMKPPTRLCVMASQSGTQHWSETQGNPRSSWAFQELLGPLSEEILKLSPQTASQHEDPSPYEYNPGSLGYDSHRFLRQFLQKEMQKNQLKVFCNAHYFTTWWYTY